MHDWGRCGGDNAKRSKERAGHGAGEVVGPDRTGWACGGSVNEFINEFIHQLVNEFMNELIL